MPETTTLLDQLTKDYKNLFQKREVILSFGAYLERVRQNPSRLIRSAAEYLRDTFDFFGTRDIGEGENNL